MATDTTDTTPRDSEALIAGRYLVDPTQALPDAGGGILAFAALDRHTGRRDVMALQVSPEAPARAPVISDLAAHPMEGILAPLAHGCMRMRGGTPALVVIGQAPPGPSLLARLTRPWTESELLEDVLHPVAVALETLRARGLTHRAIRPQNLFSAGKSQPTVLGSFWAEPAASLQPVIFEPPYVAMCGPAARGDGCIADDVYALGITLLVLATGRIPLEGLDDPTIIQRKLEVGSFEALKGDARLPPNLADLLRGMLTEAPERRPSPALLADLAATRARRTAIRPPRRAKHPLEYGTRAIWNPSMLAHALAIEPGAVGPLLRGGTIERWLRLGVGDIAMATRIEETWRRVGEPPADEPLSEAVLTMRTIAVLDPLAPLYWRHLAIWPDALGTQLAASPNDERVDEILQHEAIGIWALSRPERCDPTSLRLDARLRRALLRLPGWAGGRQRLRYAANSMQPCASPLLKGQIVVRLAELLPALESTAPDDPTGSRPVDHEIAAFIGARYDQRADAELAALKQPTGAASGALTLLRLFAGIQARFGPRDGLPRLARWLAPNIAPAVENWQNRYRRARMTAAIAEVTATGQLSAMVALLDDAEALAIDASEAAAAARSVAAIDVEIAGISSSGTGRLAAAQRAGTEIAAAIGALALAAATAFAVLA